MREDRECIELGALVERCDAAHCVIDVVLLARDPSDPRLELELHRAAAAETLGVVDRRWAARAERAGADPEKIFRLHSQPERATGERIDWETFVGSPQRVDGFAGAFSFPVHGLAIDDASTAALLAELCAFFTAQRAPGDTIYAWSNDWSNYFVGREEWGGLLWTMELSRLDRLVGLAASDVD